MNKKISAHKALLGLEVIDLIMKNEVIFSDQRDQHGAGYDPKLYDSSFAVELGLDKKELIYSLGADIMSATDDILRLLSERGEIRRFFEIIIGKDAVAFFKSYSENLVVGMRDRIDAARAVGGSHGSAKILRADGTIDEVGSAFKSSSQSSDDFIKKLNDIKTGCVTFLDYLSSFSMDDLLKPKGYQSLDELSLYYDRFQSLAASYEYKNFFVNHDGARILKETQDFDFEKYISEKFSFFIKEGVSIYGSRYFLSLNRIDNSFKNFLLLDKNKIDNFKEFIDSFAVVLKNNISGVTYFYANLEDPESLELAVNKFINGSSGKSGGLYYGSEKDTSNQIIIKYYKDKTKFSYENGLFWVYYNFIIDNLIKPAYDEVSGKYKKQAEMYNIEFLKNIGLNDFISLIIKNANSSYYQSASYFKAIAVLKKENISVVGDYFKDNLNNQIIKKIKNNKDDEPLDIDSILMEVDTGYKNGKFDLDCPVQLNLRQDSIKEIINEFLNISNKLISKNIFGNASKEIQDRINKTETAQDMLSDDDIIKISLSERFVSKSSSNGYSYRGSIERLNSTIEAFKNRLKNKTYSFGSPGIYYALKGIDANLFDGFFDGLKKVLTKQIQQEEACFQGKSTSMGILYDITLDETPLKNNQLDTYDLDTTIYNFPQKSIFSLFKSFSEQFFENFRYIYLYFSIFPAEAVQFFSLTDFNQIKTAIIKMCNFLNNADNKINMEAAHDLTGDIKLISLDGKVVAFRNINDIYSEEYERLRSEYYSHDREDIEEFEKIRAKINEIGELRESFKNSSFSVVEFLVKLFEKKDVGTKKEKIQKVQQIAKVIHNFSNEPKYLGIILNSKYIDKAFNKSIFDVFMELGSVVNQKINVEKSLNYIITNYPQYIPSEYLTEDILFCINNIDKINNSSNLDLIIEKLLSGNVSENTKRFKYLVAISTQFETTSEWMSRAKQKVDDVFAPNFSTDTFRFRVLGNLDPYHFRVGADTECCQAIGGAGENAAIDSFINPDAGVLLLEVKVGNEWRLAAQSYFHYAEVNEKAGTKKAILLDNIEAGSLKRLYDKSEFYRKAYATLAKLLKDKGFDIVGCGKSYTQVINSDDFKTTKLSEDPRHFEIEKYDESRYEDFDSDDFLNLLEPNFSFDIPQIKSLNSEMSTKSAAILKMYFNKIGYNKVNTLYKLSSILNLYSLKKECLEVNYLIPEMIW